MAQARRRRPAKANPKRGSGQRNIGPMFAAFKRGFVVFATGSLAGVLATLFWQGYHSEDQGDLGSGLKDMIEQSRVLAKRRAEQVVVPEMELVDKAPRVKPQYDFYTVLPEIEEVMPKDTPPAQPPVSAAKVADKAKKPPTEPTPPKPLAPGGAYMLQVASYGQKADAERLKAKLALAGLSARVQNVTIENKNYYRVRIGPYSDYGSMTSDDYKLSQMGFKAMRLRLSQAG